MPRYFIEVAYKGTAYAGFQVQQNANSIQAEMEKALSIYFKTSFELTGSSRTDAGVHALQNFFHFDTSVEVNEVSYHLNAILPNDIVVKAILKVKDDAHCRFDALGREYAYHLYDHKDPFLADRAWYFPYALNLQAMVESAKIVLGLHDFTSFSKRNTQVKTFMCNLERSEWKQEPQGLVYYVKGNRFLRGMVRGLVGTMVQVGRGKLTVDQFREILIAKDCKKADFSVPAHGLFLQRVFYP